MVVLPVPKAGKGQEDPHTHQDDVANRTHDCFSPIQRASILADNLLTASANYLAQLNPSFFTVAVFYFCLHCLRSLQSFPIVESASLRTASPLVSDSSLRERETLQAYGSLQDLSG